VAISHVSDGTFSVGVQLPMGTFRFLAFTIANDQYFIKKFIQPLLAN
jgi:hypothetical protein